MIGNPIRSTPRYAKLFNSGIRGQAPHIPDVGSGGKADAVFYGAGKFARANPLLAAASIPLGISLNNMALNPIGGVIDAATFGLTNLRPNEWEQQTSSIDDIRAAQAMMEMQRPHSSQVMMAHEVPIAPQPGVNPAVPPLNEEQVRRQKDYLQRKIATDMLTVAALEEEMRRQG